jgi:hypothetical protein
MITIVDFEASGLESDSYPIQVAWNIGDEIHSYYIHPKSAHEWVGWSILSEHVHGISRDYLDVHGSSVDKVAERMNDSLRGMTVYSDAVFYDKGWCQRLFAETPHTMTFEFKDFWESIRQYAPFGIRDAGAYGMTEWSNQLIAKAKGNLPDVREHLADNDVKIRMEIVRLARSWGE